MNANQVAQKIRNEIKKTGTNPKGMVSVRNTDYSTMIEFNLRGLYGEDLERVEDFINDLPESDEYGFDNVG